jgi:hypothetical protein
MEIDTVAFTSACYDDDDATGIGLERNLVRVRVLVTRNQF